MDKSNYVKCLDNLIGKNVRLVLLKDSTTVLALGILYRTSSESYIVSDKGFSIYFIVDSVTNIHLDNIYL